MRFCLAALSVMLVFACTRASAQGDDGQKVAMAPGTTVRKDAVGKSCHEASDCHGMLPRICRKCADGKSECAKFVCDEGTCRTITCDAHPAGLGEACNRELFGKPRPCIDGLTCQNATDGGSGTCIDFKKLDAGSP